MGCVDCGCKDGARGPQGIQGPKGEKGDTGEQGLPGTPGLTGATGPIGPQGEQGIQGLKGDTGADGLPGAQGSPGSAGSDGAPGVDGAPGADGLKGDTGDEGASAYQVWLSLGNTGTEQEFIDSLKGEDGIEPDTGWVDLLGFCHQVTKPQCRRIGPMIHFRGFAVIPLADALGDPIPYVDSSSYATAVYSALKFPFTGVCGVDTNSAGGITFNKSASVIPPSVYSGVLDNAYRMDFEIITRSIELAPDASTALSSVINVQILPDGKLFLSTIKDSEQIYTNFANAYPLRYITSQITLGEKVPDYLASNIHSDSAAAPWPVQIPQDGTYTWPLSLDGGNEQHLGGFIINLDGLIGYIAP